MPQTLNEWVKRDEVDKGVTTSEAQRMKELEREVKELRRVQRNSEAGERVFRPGGARPPTEVLRDFIDKHRGTFGVEPICKVLQVAPSGSRQPAARGTAARAAQALCQSTPR